MVCLYGLGKFSLRELAFGVELGPRSISLQKEYHRLNCSIVLEVTNIAVNNLVLFTGGISYKVQRKLWVLISCSFLFFGVGMLS